MSPGGAIGEKSRKQTEKLEYLHWRIAPRGAGCIQESENFHRI